MFIHFFCLCPLGLATKLNFNISKEAYSIKVALAIGHWQLVIGNWSLGIWACGKQCNALLE